eukprot:3296829-Lingulodinium_polyedra.AAC.1
MERLVLWVARGHDVATQQINVATLPEIRAAMAHRGGGGQGLRGHAQHGPRPAATGEIAVGDPRLLEK